MRIAAEITQLAVADVVARGAKAQFFLHVHQRGGQALGIFARSPQNVKRQPLRRLLADARQALELLDKAS